MTWGYLPHEDKYNKPTIDGRNAAVIMKSGVYDGATDTHKLMGQEFTREDTLHAWYDEAGGPVHPFDRTTKPIAKNDLDHAGKYSWATAVAHIDNGRLEAGPLARQLVAGGSHGESFQWTDPLVLDMYKKMGGANVALRHFARMHEGAKIYREIERVLRELRLNDEWYIKPTEKDGQGWGATEAIRGALCHWIEVQGGKIKNYQMIAPTTWNVGPARLDRRTRSDRGSLDRHPDQGTRPIPLKSAMSQGLTTLVWFAQCMRMMQNQAKNSHASGPPDGRLSRAAIAARGESFMAASMWYRHRGGFALGSCDGLIASPIHANGTKVIYLRQGFEPSESLGK